MANWEEVLNEISLEQQGAQLQAQRSFDTVRRKYLSELSNLTGRNIIAYYSGWQSKPGISGTEIRDEDRDGFMRAMHGLDPSRGLDLILHTPGGSIAATQSIITYLREKFGRDIRAIVPHTAMSGGTIMACASKEIIMARHSSIGPIDPQIRGIPAQGVLKEFERAFHEISINPQKANVWAPILAQYTPTFVGNCENAVKWSETFARQQLADNMFYKSKGAQKKINSIIQSLTAYDEVKLHERQIGYKEAIKTGLKITLLEDSQALQDAVVTVHHCYVHVLSNTPVFKIIENQQGASFLKIQTA